MVQGLAAQSGGLLRIHSEPNAGTVVELWLPRATTAAAALVRPPESTLRSGRRPSLVPCSSSMTTRLVMTGTAAMILDLGHTAVEAHSGAEALEPVGLGSQGRCRVDRPRDAHDDRIAARRMHSQRFPGLPIILATGYAELPVDPATLGIARLAKPCTQHEIAAAIHHAVRADARRESSGFVGSGQFKLCGMKFCIYGAGAIGGYLAVELALSGQEVCVIARGAHLDGHSRARIDAEDPRRAERSPGWPPIRTRAFLAARTS